MNPNYKLETYPLTGYEETVKKYFGLHELISKTSLAGIILRKIFL